jgi:hypothetical protein
MAMPAISDLLALTGLSIDPRIQAWGFTPEELSRTLEARDGVPFLGMMLHESREVYVEPRLKTKEGRHD